MTFHVPDEYRVREGMMKSDASFGNNGAFLIPRAMSQLQFKAIASDGADWEHVSVSLPNRCPSWQEMCFIKAIFWDSEDCVMQLHPPASEYVNKHPYCLHLWRPVKHTIPKPPTWMVG